MATTSTQGVDFTSGADFVAFDPPSPNAAAGPSGTTSHPDSNSDEVRAGKKRKADSNGVTGNPNKKGKGKGKNKDKGNRKGKAAQGESINGVSAKGKQRANGDVNGSSSHVGSQALDRGCPWVDMVDWEACKDPAEMLNSEVQAFYRYMSPTRAEYEVRLFVIELITRTVKKTWPDAEVHPFGSWQTQLYLPSGDIDLVVTTPRLTPSNKAKLLAELARAMRMAYLTDVVAIISKARVPIIKFVTNQGSLNVDISLNQTNGINAGMIINQYLDILPGARQLILVVKAFLSQRSMNEVYTGGLGSYAVICLVISFLQVHPKLRRSEIDPERNLGTLLIEFFELYGRNFNYEDVGLSIRRGGFYFSKRSRGWYRSMQSFALSIEDPQDKGPPDNDISSGSYGIRQVRATLAGAFEMLQAKLFERAENMYSSGRRGSDEVRDPADMSILGGIMEVSKETLKHRHELLRLHQEGRLHRMLEIPVGVDPTTILVHYQAHLSPPPEENIPIRRSKHANGIAKLNGDLQAIIVNDDEIDVGDMDSESNEEDQIGEEGESSDGVVEVLPYGSDTKVTDRFASVSVDESEDEIEEGNDEEVREGDSRYAMGRSRKTQQPNVTGQQDAGDNSDSDESIMAIEPPVSSRGTSSRSPTKGRFARAKEKRDFWSSKGKVEVESVNDSDDE